MRDETITASMEESLRKIALLEVARERLSSPSKRSSLLCRLWNWYARITGWEKASLQRRTGLKIRSTAYPSA